MKKSMGRILVLLLSLVVLLAFSISANASDVSKGVQVAENGNHSIAAKLYKVACDFGDAKRCTDLGILYYNGQGVRQNYPTTAKLFRKACDDGALELHLSLMV